MRLWSLHPRFLDVPGLTAAWREGLLARKVLEGETRGYRHHPQLERFKACPDPVGALNAFLYQLCEEAGRRGYRFDKSKLPEDIIPVEIEVTEGQLNYEWQHLMTKLSIRSPQRFEETRALKPEPHPIFKVIPGGIASWERP